MKNQPKTSVHAKNDALWHHLLSLAAIIICGAVIYSNSYRVPFIFDDLPNIVSNPYIRMTAFDSENLARATIQGPTATRPLTSLSFALNYYWDGYNVYGYHLFNVIIHILNGFFVYILTLLLLAPVASDRLPGVERFDRSSRLWISTWAALIFIAHPLQTQAVTYIVQRYTSMAAFFYLAALICFCWARHRQLTPSHAKNKIDRPAIILIGLAFLLGLLAFLNKQNAVTLPGVIIAVEFLFFDRSWVGWKRKIMWMAPLCALFGTVVFYLMGGFKGAADFGSLISDVSNMLQETEKIGRWPYLVTQMTVLVIYLRLLILPIHQNLDYLYPFKNSFFDGLTPLAFSFLAGLLALGIWQCRRRPLITFGVIWFFVTLSVESSIVPIQDALFEHRLYLPVYALALLLPYLILKLMGHKQLIAKLVLACAVIALGATAWNRNLDWQSPLSIWSDVVDKAPHNYRGHTNLGIALFRSDQRSEALKRFQRALELNPDYADAHYNIGVVYDQMEKPQEAIEHYRQAVRLRPQSLMAQNNLAVALGRSGQLEEAIEIFKQALNNRQTVADTYLNLGVALVQQGYISEAIENYNKALDIDPLSVLAHYYLGLAKLRQQDLTSANRHFKAVLDLQPNHAGARRYYQLTTRQLAGDRTPPESHTQALRKNPYSPAAHFNRGNALAAQGKMSEAVKAYQDALALNSRYTEAYVNLGVTLGRMARYDEAIENFEKALELNPNSPEVHTSMGVAFYLKGDHQKALFHYGRALKLDPQFREAQKNMQVLLKQMGVKGKQG